MKKGAKGFTLIELLIVVAVIGILAAILIPNALAGIQKSKQKQTMRDIIGIATACADYVTDRGSAPDSGNQSGPISSGSNFVSGISPHYLKVCPIVDSWRNTFHAYTGATVSNAYSIPATDLGLDDFLIVSLGRDGSIGGNITYTYQADNLAAGLYNISSMADFDNDLVNMNGTWLHAPRIAETGS